jgi:hypothetical protein
MSPALLNEMNRRPRRFGALAGLATFRPSLGQALVACFLAFAGGAAASAQEPCACPPLDPGALFERSALVFRGRVTRVERVAFREVSNGEATIVRTDYVTFQPLQRFKGPKADLYVVSNAKCETPEAEAQLCRAACAEPFQIDAVYVVFALPDGEEPATTGHCQAFSVASDKADAERSLRWLKAHK